MDRLALQSIIANALRLSPTMVTPEFAQRNHVQPTKLAGPANLPKKRGGLNRSVQHHLIGVRFLRVVFMAQGKRNRLSTEQRIEMRRRWKAGESLHDIGRAFGKGHGSIRFLLRQRGGIVPAARRRSPRTLTLAEREDISRGIVSGSSMCEIAKRLQRAVSTVSREVARHGCRPLYQASEADRQAWESALRPKVCLLANHETLRTIVASKTDPGLVAGTDYEMAEK